MAAVDPAGGSGRQESPRKPNLIRYSEDGKQVTVHNRTYDLYDGASLSLITCPQAVEEVMRQWDNDQ